METNKCRQNMDKNKSRSLPVLKVHPPLKPVKTILKSTAAMSAKLELAHAYVSKKDWPVVSKNISGDSHKMVQNQKTVLTSSASTSNSKFTGRQETRAEVNEDPFSLSFMYDQVDQASGLDLGNISVDDINVSILAHDGSGISSDPSFSGLESQEVTELPSKQKSNNWTSLMKMKNNKCDTQQIDNQLQPSTVNDESNAVSLPHTHTAILSLSNNETEDKGQDQHNSSTNTENSFDVSFDTSRGHGAIRSSSLLISSQMFPDSNNIDNPIGTVSVSSASACSSESGLIIDLNYVGVQAETVSAPNHNLNDNTPDPEPTPVVTTSNSGSDIPSALSTATQSAAAMETEAEAEVAINGCNTNTDTIDVDLAKIALARRGNPENLYGLLAGFITTGKKSRNPITINLNQCYNCDGSCVRNTISISKTLSNHSSPLKVSKNGIESVGTSSRMQEDLIQQTSCNLNAAVKHVVGPQCQSNLVTHNKSAKAAEGENVLNSLLPIHHNVIKPASFSPYTRMASRSQHASSLVESRKLSTTFLPLTSQNQTSKIDGLNESHADAGNLGINNNNTFLVSSLADLGRSNVNEQYVNIENTETNNNNSTFVVRNSSFQEPLQNQGEELQHDFLPVADSEISPITKPGSKNSDAKVNFIPTLRILPRSNSKRKRGIKRSKRQVLKTKTKKVKSASTLPSSSSTSASASTSSSAAPCIQSRRIQKNAKTPPRGLLDSSSTSDSLACPILSPHFSDATRSIARNMKTVEVELQDDERVSDDTDEEDVDSNVPSKKYLNMYNSTPRTNSRNAKLATLEYSCKKCEFRTMSSVTVDRKLKDHFKKHKLPSQFQCLYCSKEYSAISSRTRHVLTCARNPNRNR